MSTAPPCGQSVYSSRCPYLIRMMTEGVWAMAPIMLHTQITQRKVRKACWQPGLGHFPGKATASSLVLDIHVQLVRFWNRDKKWEWIWRSNRTAALYVCMYICLLVWALQCLSQLWCLHSLVWCSQRSRLRGRWLHWNHRRGSLMLCSSYSYWCTLTRVAARTAASYRGGQRSR